MKRFMPTPGMLANKITLYHVLLLFISLPLDRFFSEVVFVSFIIHTLIHLKASKLNNLYHPLLLVVPGVFFISLLSSLYGGNTSTALTACSNQLPFLFIPVLFLIHRELIWQYRHTILKVFGWSCLAVVLYLYGVVFLTMLHFHLSPKSLFSESFINHNFSKPVGIHATFFSGFVVMAVIIFFKSIIAERNTKLKMVYGAATFLMLLALVQLSSKTGIITLVLVLNIFLPFYYTKGGKRYVTSATLWLVTISGLVIACFSANLRARLLTDLNNDLDLSKVQLVTDSRVDRWKVALETAMKKPFFGYGNGKEQDVMHQAYFDHKLYHSYIFQLNAHNQFLSILIKSGIVGLVLFITLLAYGLVVGIRNKDLLLTTLLVFIIVASVSENVLDANKGIMLYSMFFSISLLAPAMNFKRKSIRFKATEVPVLT
ncbi:O-antigen ligase family protein [Mucilaginibacter sp. KACC 22063]|uniref:O-antigen ligase family protein n=1 Tax=Mucilaginibacter sp. KACC 22063 TaxID=3025666 RepID=UPI00236634EF|nr:O-antigen ligase family protein [Mucilaginibacter sp. KACC 22063]WDF53811.1 O-antigen ligase family protein [Mucilaginibacter sp. KACC 22063]